ncbi:MAG: VWA domain-containing protein [Acidobacteriaceae bacterium]|nr:VWA domain-containing protein [Acidobacteriaceae bacterium]MBV8572438.1 VWA domain-containing protein [Acidobacteriaceae bacterium]
MKRFLFPLLVVLAIGARADDDPVTFKSDVSMTRVDAQVLDETGRAITGLQLSDFVLRLNGRVVPIRNLASENMPLDVLLLLDVSGSMEPHVERIASASQQALNVLTGKDRVGIMVFDTYTRVRLPFRNSHSDVERELNHLIRSERFNGGTRITHALLDAARYIQREARPEARRAIVILTDDETQDEENEPRVESALAEANAVLSFLQAPYEVPTMAGGGRPHGTWGSGGGWPGGGIGFPGGGGPIILGRRGPGGGYGIDPSHTAGTAEIARDSGGDVMHVDEASALEDTLMRLRQRYALYFYLPEGVTAGQERVQVNLAQETMLRYRDAEVRYRRVYMASNGGNERSGPAAVTRTSEVPIEEPSLPSEQPENTENTVKRRRAAVNEDSGPVVNTVGPDSDNTDQQGASQTQQQSSESTPATPAPRGGWPRAHPQNPPQ